MKQQFFNLSSFLTVLFIVLTLNTSCQRCDPSQNATIPSVKDAPKSNNASQGSAKSSSQPKTQQSSEPNVAENRIAPSGDAAPAASIELLPNPTFVQKGIRPVIMPWDKNQYREQKKHWVQKMNQILNTLWGESADREPTDHNYTEIVEIAQNHFFYQEDNPKLIGNSLVYQKHDEQGNLVKQLAIRKSDEKSEIITKMKFDTSREWRNGFNLNAPLNNGDLPIHRQNRPQNHFLIRQKFTDPTVDGPNYPFEKRPHLGKFSKIWLSLDFDLIQLERVVNTEYSKWPTQTKTVLNGALFYAAITVCHKDYRKNRQNGTQQSYDRFYLLVPIARYNFDGHKESFKPKHGMGYDLDGKPVSFHSPANFNDIQKIDGWIKYENIDFSEIAKEAIRRFNKKNHSDFQFEEYYLDAFLIGWEIWGAWKTEIEMKNISLKGFCRNGCPITQPTSIH